MARFRSRPIEIEAEQWWPNGPDPAQRHPGVFWDERIDGREIPYVITMYRQRVNLVAGDWIIREPDGVHYYPCTPVLFAARYEPVSDEIVSTEHRG